MSGPPPRLIILSTGPVAGVKSWWCGLVGIQSSSVLCLSVFSSDVFVTVIARKVSESCNIMKIDGI